jgi:hypothetical protein
MAYGKDLFQVISVVCQNVEDYGDSILVGEYTTYSAAKEAFNAE